MSKRLGPILFSAACLSLGPAPDSRAEGLNFDILASTPVGSWQVRETTFTSNKGKKQRLTVIRTSLVGEEERGGEEYVWMEMVVDNYKLKKGKRKKDGDTSIVKVLVKKSALKMDPANIVNNLTASGEEIIFQTGDKDPMRITGGGALAQGLMKGLGTKVTFDFKELGVERVTLPVGELECRKISGTGSTEMKVLFKTIKVDSETQIWLSEQVPFGMVKAIGSTTVNGKQESSEAIVTDYGESGASSRITKEPVEMPSFKMPFGR